MAVLIEAFSDVVCPWCFIGKRRIERALARLAADDLDVDFEVVYRPFQLDPHAPLGHGEPAIDAYARKFGGPERAAEIIARVTEAAAGEGIDFHLDRAVRANTADAHRLIWWTLAQAGPAVQRQLVEDLMVAYFCDGVSLGDHDALVPHAAGVGLDGDAARSLLDGEEGLDAHAVALQRAADLGVTAVPTYLIDGSWAIPGAQDADTFERILRQVATRTPVS